MAFRFDQHESVESGVRRIAVEQVDRVLEVIADRSMPDHEAVHQARRACKRVRGLLHLIRPACDSFKQENGWFRETGRSLGTVRDAFMQESTWNRLIERAGTDRESEAAALVSKHLTKRRVEAEGEGGPRAKLESLRPGFTESRRRASEWALKAAGFEALEEGAERAYRRSREALRACRASAEHSLYHDWRKAAQRHRFHVQLLESLWPAAMKSFDAELKRLSDSLGVDHDLEVLLQAIKDVADSSGARQASADWSEAAASWRSELRREAIEIGDRVFDEKPKRWIERVEALWTEWRD